MNSLRGRLTFSYAIVVAIVLWVVSLLACRIALDVTVHGMLEGLSLGAARAENIAANAGPAASRDEVIARMIAVATLPGVKVLDFEPRERFGHPHRVDGPPPPDRERGRGRASPVMLAGTLLGISPHVIDMHGYHLLVVPDLDALEPVLRTFGWICAGALVLSTFAAWALASWLAGQAILPLLTVTSELERFASGDFSPRPISTSDCSELGGLIAAYNGAAAQVTRAFDERLAVEAQMRRFVADAGHELRTPLTVIGGYLEILRKGGIDDARMRERAFTTLSGETHRMRRLIDRLLALARLERPDLSELTRVELPAAAADAAAHVRAARGGEIVLICNEHPVVFADPAELAQAIENVIDNGVKYGGGTPVTVRIGSADGVAVIQISDGGSGIPEAERGRLFERFFRGDERGDIAGSGLGLAIAERAIRRCRGAIALEDGRPGHTTFRLTIPLAPQPALTAPLHL